MNRDDVVELGSGHVHQTLVGGDARNVDHEVDRAERFHTRGHAIGTKRGRQSVRTSSAPAFFVWWLTGEMLSDGGFSFVGISVLYGINDRFVVGGRVGEFIDRPASR
ncbi:MAG: hypothetical protein QOH34_3481 [Mycobacterium sp.]|nr:hypothetical protein [Mycobacterium sp.]